MDKVAYAALWMYVFSMQCEDLVGLTSAGAISRVMAIPALVLALLTVAMSGRFRRLHPFHVAAILFVVVAACGMLFLHSGQEIPRKLWTYVQQLLVLWMIWELAPSWQRLVGLMTAYVFGSYVAAFGTILIYARDAGLRRFSIGGGDANDLAMTLALALPMAWYLGLVYRRPLLRWICRGYFPVGLLAIGLTGSRGGLLATMVALMVVPLTMTRLSPGKLAMALVTLGASGALAVAYVPEKVVQRLATTTTEVEDLNLGGRFRVWKAGINAFVQRPLMGYGTSSFKLVVAPWLMTRLGESKVAHNSFLSVLVEQGMVGFLLYAMMFLAVFLALLELPVVERRFGLVLLATLCTAMLPLTWEDRKAVWFILAALVGLSRAWAGKSAPGQRPALRGAPVRPSPMARFREPLIAPGPGAERDPAV